MAKIPVTGRKGNIGVAAVQLDLLRRGYEVLVPVAEMAAFDLVAFSQGKFWTIQVKYVAEKNGSLEALFRRRIVCNSRICARNLTKMDADIGAIYCPQTEKCYYIRLQNFSSVSLRLEPTKNNLQKRVRFAEDYCHFPPKR